MRKACSFIIGLTVLINISNAQELHSNAKNYTLITEVVAQEIDFIEKKLQADKSILYADVVFQKIEQLNIEGVDYTIVKTTERLKGKQEERNVNPKYSGVSLMEYYAVETESFLDNHLDYTPKGWDLKIGFSVIPFKIYAFQGGDDPLDFSPSNVSMGPSLGWAHQISRRKSDLWLTYKFSMNISSVTPRPDEFTDPELAGNDLVALSPAIGASLNYNTAEVTLYFGKDYLPGNAAASWKYNGATWFSVAMGLFL